MKAVLALADGRVFEGRSFGATGEATGEVVFQHRHVGLPGGPDRPSYRGQYGHYDLSADGQTPATIRRMWRAAACFSPVSSSRNTSRGIFQLARHHEPGATTSGKTG